MLDFAPKAKVRLREEATEVQWEVSAGPVPRCSRAVNENPHDGVSDVGEWVHNAVTAVGLSGATWLYMVMLVSMSHAGTCSRGEFRTLRLTASDWLDCFHRTMQNTNGPVHGHPQCASWPLASPVVTCSYQQAQCLEIRGHSDRG